LGEALVDVEDIGSKMVQRVVDDDKENADGAKPKQMVSWPFQDMVYF